MCYSRRKSTQFLQYLHCKHRSFYRSDHNYYNILTIRYSQHSCVRTRAPLQTNNLPVRQEQPADSTNA
mgnify:CR=1 FL=1